MDWRARFELELANAGRARARGNEGQARVCARRAAGVAAAEYYSRRGLAPKSASALDELQQLLNDPDVPAGALPAIKNLLLKVDEAFQLPDGVDLIHDARLLLAQLLPED